MAQFRVFLHATTLDPNLPGEWQPVVVDVLRATTTVAAALHAGAEGIVPATTVEQARRLHDAYSGPRVLAGERQGHPPDGFDLGNSPLQMTPERVQGRRIFLTTTNGTSALLVAETLGPVYCASFANLEAVTIALNRTEKNIVVLCAGAHGQTAAEDLAVAGALADQLRAAPTDELAVIARAWYRDSRDDLVGMLARTTHGQYLMEQGYRADLEFCARLNSCPCLGVLQGGVIRSIEY